MPTNNGVIETLTGDLLRAGYCDFENDGSFNSLTETYITDVPQPSKCRGGEVEDGKMHRWTGSEWTEVDQP